MVTSLKHNTYNNLMKHLLKYLGVTFFFLGTFFFVFQLQSCKHEPQGLDQFDLICFKTQVAPILVSQCSSCHGGTRGKGGYVIDSVYNNVKGLVKAGNPWGSKLYTIVSSPNNPNMMPPNKALSKDQLTILELWIAQGALNGDCSSTNTQIQPIASTDGAVLYSTYCSGCHGPLATSAKIGVTASQIQTGISTVPDMKNLSVITATQQQAIANVLVGTPNANPDGTLLYTNTCAKCHGSLATSQVGGASASKITSAIKSKTRMNYLSSLTAAQISAIASVLSGIAGSGD
jgi:mono/diheme cytochrome c family protein